MDKMEWGMECSLSLSENPSGIALTVKITDVVVIFVNLKLKKPSTGQDFCSSFLLFVYFTFQTPNSLFSVLFCFHTKTFIYTNIICNYQFGINNFNLKLKRNQIQGIQIPHSKFYFYNSVQTTSSFI